MVQTILPLVSTSKIHTYDAATAPRGMLKHFLPIIGYPRVVAENTTILANFFRRDLLGRFRGSFLGLFWVLVQPMFLFAIYFMVFGFLFAPKSEGPGAAPKVEFAIYLFSGIIVFMAFSESTTRSCSLILENGNLVKKVAFPCELLPIPSILVSLIVYSVGAVVLLAIGIPLGEIHLGMDALALPLVMIVFSVMCLGVGLLLATLQVLLRDTLHLYTLSVQAWFFLSPVFWNYAMLEDKLGKLVWLFELNPMYPLVQANRIALGFGPGTVVDGVVVDGHALMRRLAGDPLPSVWQHLGYASLWAVGFLLVGYAFFMSRKNKFSDLV